ncbi:hypothetical protein [Sphingobacterium sp. LRF_L2]|uniref:hypothetical protein n=1 Tax=Sphingobacterium sp. LRF_L2 TaxID=3369421 RepID=UPI003F63BBAC
MENNQSAILKFLKEDIRYFKAKSFGKTFIEEQGLTIPMLLEYSIHADTQIAFRASWLLEHVLLDDNTLIKGMYITFLSRLKEQCNWSCIRSYTKICMLLTHPSQRIVILKQQEEQLIIECCFNWIINANCPVAVTVNCLNVLYYLSDSHTWVKEELIAQIHFLLKNPTPALKSRANRILKRIL